MLSRPTLSFRRAAGGSGDRQSWGHAAALKSAPDYGPRQRRHRRALLGGQGAVACFFDPLSKILGMRNVFSLSLTIIYLQYQSDSRVVGILATLCYTYL